MRSDGGGGRGRVGPMWVRGQGGMRGRIEVIIHDMSKGKARACGGSTPQTAHPHRDHNHHTRAFTLATSPPE